MAPPSPDSTGVKPIAPCQINSTMSQNNIAFAALFGRTRAWTNF